MLGLVLNDVCTVFDGHRAAKTILACTDAFSISSATCSCHAGDTGCDGDVAAGRIIASRSDAGSILATRSIDRAAADGDGVARSRASRADAGSNIATRGCDVAALDDDVTAGNLISAAYAAAFSIAAGRELACAGRAALDGECLVLWHVNAGISRMESLHRVLAAVGQDDGGVALAGEAGVFTITPGAVCIDARAVERHRGAVGNRNLHVCAECARQRRSVLNGRSSSHLRQVDGLVGIRTGGDIACLCAADGHGAAGATLACTDAIRSIFAFRSRHAGDGGCDVDGAIIDLKSDDLATIDPTEIIDFKAVASDVRAILSEVKAAAEDANRNNYADLAKTTAKNVLKSSAQIVASLLQAKVPALPALALAAQWEDTVGVRSVLSDFSIAATAYKPLSFGFGTDLIDGRTVSFDRLDNLAARIIDKVKNKIPTFSNITVSDVTLGTVTVYDGVTPVGTVDLSGVATNINGAFDITDLNNAIQDLIQLSTDAKSYADRAKSFEVRVSEFLEREINRVITKVSTDGLTRILEPIILFQAGDNYNVSRFYEGATIAAGKVTLVPTTMTNELLAPAYKKYVAVKNNKTNAFVYQKVLTKGDADFNKVDVNLAAGNYSIIYSALDFSGVQISKKYNVVVK